MRMKLELFTHVWFRTRAGELAVVFNTGVGIYPLVGARGGVAYMHECWTADGFSSMRLEKHDNDLVDHLPECTGWDWEPKDRLQMLAEKIRKTSKFIPRGLRLKGVDGSCLVAYLNKIADELEETV